MNAKTSGRSFHLSTLLALAIGWILPAEPAAALDRSSLAPPPSAPRSLSAVAAGPTTINLSWRAPASTGGRPIQSYQVEVSANGGSTWSFLTEIGVVLGTSYSHTGLRAGQTRHYRVRARNADGLGTAATASATTTGGGNAPGTPRNFRASASGSTAINLSWRAPSTTGSGPIQSYQVEVSANGGSTWSFLVRTLATATSYRHTGLRAGSRRHYRIRAQNASGAGSWATANATTTGGGGEVPGRPRSVRAEAQDSISISLSWQTPASGGSNVTRYEIRGRRVADNNPQVWPEHWRPGTNTRSFTHSGLRPAEAWRYQVRAVNSAGAAGPWSFEAGTATHPGRPGAPTRLSARPNGGTEVRLSWIAPRQTGGSGVRILGYRIEQARDRSGPWRILRSNTGSATTSFTHTGLSPATTRYYRVRAINTAGLSDPSSVASATTDSEAPGAPGSLRATAAGSTEIALEWTAPGYDGGSAVTGYQIDISSDAGKNWQKLTNNTGSEATAYRHTKLSPATTRHYRVRAINAIGRSDPSNVARATTDAVVPDAPTGLTATAVSPTQIDLAWTAPGYNGGADVTGYRIEVSETGEGEWGELAANTRSPVTAHAHRDLRPGSQRFYRVRALNRVGASDPSGIAGAATDDPVQRAERLNRRVLPHVAAAMTTSAIGAIAERIEAAALGPSGGMEMEMGGLNGLAARLGSADGAFGHDRIGFGNLLDGASFSLSRPQQAIGAPTVSVWGAGEYQSLGEPEATGLEWSGDLVNVHLGADLRIASDILGGVAISRADGSFDFTDRTGARPASGVYGTTLTAANPYLAWLPGGRGNALWAAGSFGWGDVEINDSRTALRTSPARTVTGAIGGSYQVLQAGSVALKLRAEGWSSRVTVEGSEPGTAEDTTDPNDETGDGAATQPAAAIGETMLSLQRGRLMVELAQGYRMGASEVGVSVEGGVRYDNGDIANGAGMEAGGSLRFANRALGLAIEGRDRVLVAGHEGYEEWGVGGTILFDPEMRGQGFSVRLSPSYGDAASGLNALWEQGVAGQGGPGDRTATHPAPAPTLDGEIAYGFASRRGTPYSAFHLGRDGRRALSSGLRYDLGQGFGVRVEASRHDGGFGTTRHNLGIRGRVELR